MCSTKLSIVLIKLYIIDCFQFEARRSVPSLINGLARLHILFACCKRADLTCGTKSRALLPCIFQSACICRLSVCQAHTGKRMQAPTGMHTHMQAHTRTCTHTHKWTHLHTTHTHTHVRTRTHIICIQTNERTYAHAHPHFTLSVTIHPSFFHRIALIGAVPAATNVRHETGHSDPNH